MVRRQEARSPEAARATDRPAARRCHATTARRTPAGRGCRCRVRSSANCRSSRLVQFAHDHHLGDCGLGVALLPASFDEGLPRAADLIAGKVCDEVVEQLLLLQRRSLSRFGAYDSAQQAAAVNRGDLRIGQESAIDSPVVDLSAIPQPGVAATNAPRLAISDAARKAVEIDAQVAQTAVDEDPEAGGSPGSVVRDRDVVPLVCRELIRGPRLDRALAPTIDQMHGEVVREDGDGEEDVEADIGTEGAALRRDRESFRQRISMPRRSPVGSILESTQPSDAAASGLLQIDSDQGESPARFSPASGASSAYATLSSSIAEPSTPGANRTDPCSFHGATPLAAAK